MPNTVRLKDFAKTATTLASDDYIYAGGQTNGTRKILGSDVANYVASEEGGSTLASLSGGKVPTAQLPWTSETFLGTSTVAGLPAPGGLNAGEYYTTTDSGTNHSVTFAAGDKAISDGTSYYAVADGVRPIGEGGTGATTAEGARTNLEVDSKDEIAEGLTRNEPSLWLDGSADFVSVAGGTSLSFSDGTDDLPFSISAWVKMDEMSNFVIAAKDDGASEREYYFTANGIDKLVFSILTDASNAVYFTSTDAVTDQEGKWAHVVATYGGSGPNSTTAFNSAENELTVYLNAKALAGTAARSGTFAGMTASTEPVRLGIRGSSGYAKGEIRNAQLFNTALSAADVETLYRSGVPFALDQASATAVYTSDFTSDSTDSFVADGVTLDAVSTVGSDSDNLKLVSDATGPGNHRAYKANGASAIGKRFRITGEYYIPSGQTAVDSFIVYNGAGLGANNTASFTSLTTDAWTSFSMEGLNDGTNDTLIIYLADGGTTSFAGVLGEYIAFRNIVVKESGCILDLEIGSTNGTTVPDRSGNGFNGTLNSMTVAGNLVGLPTTLSANNPNPSSGQALCSLGNNGTEVFKVDDSGNVTVSGTFNPGTTGTWTPTVSFDSGTTGITYTRQEGHYTKIGNIVVATFEILLSNKGTDTGNARIASLPFASKNVSTAHQAGAIGYYSGMASLAGAVNLLLEDGATTAVIYDQNPTGSTNVNNTNFTNTSLLRGTLTYLTD